MILFLINLLACLASLKKKLMVLGKANLLMKVIVLHLNLD